MSRLNESDLKRRLGFFAALSTVIGTTIGAGVFYKASSVVENTHSVGLSLLAWAVGGFLTIASGLTVSELAGSLPKTGGPIQYLSYTYGKPVGFLFGWAQALIYSPANIAALSIIFATQLINLFHLKTTVSISGFSFSTTILLAILCALSVLLINFLGARVAGSVQDAFLIFKLIPIALIIAVGLFLPGQVEVALLPKATGSNESLIGAFAGGLLATMFAYDGWINVCTVAGEMKNPKRDLPRAIIIGLLVITFIYIAINWVFMKNLPLNQIAGNQNTPFEVAIRLFGRFGGKLVTIGIMLSVYGSINGHLLTDSRIPFAMGIDNLLPFSNCFAKLSKHTKIPFFSASFLFFVAIIMIFLGSFDFLTNMLVFVMWLFSLLLFFAVFILRKREPWLPRPYKVPVYPVIPILAIIGGLFVIITTLITQTRLALLGLVITLCGIPVYYLHKYFVNKKG